ncbi:MAG: patatin-like phospholipase family protein [Pseudomonadota bacterium]
MRKHRINLALQGGGALGAITWGVLDRLLEEPDIAIEGASGASAGAMNAVALAHGWAEDGVAGARRALAAFWTAIGEASYAVQLPFTPSLPAGFSHSPATFLLGLTRFFSPQQMNPFDINPMRAIVRQQFDFERLRRASPVRLFVAATHVRSGSLRVFTERELTAEHLLASACLPTLQRAVVIDGDDYWDGGYTGNPPVYPLVYDCAAADLLIVMLLPRERGETPTSADGIRARLTEIHFNAAFLREMRGLALARERARRGWWPFGLERRLRALRFHVIDAEDFLRELDGAKAMNTSLAFLRELRDEGRARAEAWLAQHRASLGRRSSADIATLFGPRAR